MNYFATVFDRLQECLTFATQVQHRETVSPASANISSGDDEAHHRLQWLERQLASLVMQLQGFMLDIETGLTLDNLGYSNEEDFLEMLEYIECEVRQIQRMIKDVKGRCR